jgi:hypothetical protein
VDRSTTIALQSPEAHRLELIEQVFQKAREQKHPLTESCCTMLLYNLGYKINFIEKFGKTYTLAKEIESHNTKIGNLKFSIPLSILGILIGYIPVYLTKFNNEYLYFLSVILSLFLSIKFYELGNAPNKKYRQLTIIPLVTLSTLFIGAVFFNCQNFNGNISLFQIMFSKQYGYMDFIVDKILLLFIVFFFMFKENYKN